MVDNDKVLICPACGAKMEKIFIDSANVNLDICVNGCGGVFFDNREFSLFDEKHEDIKKISEVLKDKTFTAPVKTEGRVCPYCGSNMVKNFTSLSKEVEVDDCYNCGGKFLDNGELEKIRQQYESNVERRADINNEVLTSDEYVKDYNKYPDKSFKKSFIRKSYESVLNGILSIFVK